jgi:hypothetical protein
MDVLHIVETWDAVEWQMRLDRPWMPLSFEIFNDSLDRAPVDLPPRKETIERKRLLRSKDQQAQDALRPGRSALGIACNHDVVWTRPEGPPAIAVDQPRTVAFFHDRKPPRPLAAAIFMSSRGERGKEKVSQNDWLCVCGPSLEVAPADMVPLRLVAEHIEMARVGT